tara:strand:+ start:42 stop:566 length:525 start_codon:yes stop_codon:yes gene_type:complete
MFYTYAYLREDGSPYYIGKGTGRRIDSTNHRAPVPPKDRRLKLKDNLTEQEAYKHEMYMIGVYGRKDLGTGILINMSDGGGDDTGYKHSEERKEKISKSLKGRPKSEEWKAMMREKMKGKNVGKKRTDEQRRDISERQTGKKNRGWSKEAKRRQSERMKKTFEEGRVVWNKKGV